MATVTKGRTFTSGETVTPAKLNDVVDLATVTDIQTADIADGQITTAKILDANVSDAKLATGIDASKLTTGTLPIARIADAAVTPAKLSQPLTLATAQATTSGTSIDFTGIPSWVKRITVMFDGVSTTGTSMPLLRLGTASGLEVTGYISTCAGATTTSNTTRGGASTDGFRLGVSAHNATDPIRGALFLSTLGSNIWVASGTLLVESNYAAVCVGQKTISGTLTQIRLTTVNGTDTFDAGSVNIMYEG
jgi:hypothetical protein